MCTKQLLIYFEISLCSERQRFFHGSKRVARICSNWIALEGFFLSIVEKEKGVEYPTHEFMYLHLALHVEYHWRRLHVSHKCDSVSLILFLSQLYPLISLRKFDGHVMWWRRMSKGKRMGNHIRAQNGRASSTFFYISGLDPTRHG